MEENTIEPFCPLHIHTSRGSVLDGMIKIDELPEHCLKNNIPAVACTDHGSLSAVLSFVDECRKRGVKPLPGIEAYTSLKARGDKGPEEDGNRNYHLILLAKNDDGLHDLFKMNHIAYTEGYYFKPRMDIQLIEEYASKGNLISTSACLGSTLSQLIGRGEKRKAEQWILRLDRIFGRDNFFLEVQGHGKGESGRFQRQVNAFLIEMSNKHDIPIVMTGDSHYTRADDEPVHKELLAMQTNAKMWMPTREDQDAADAGGGAFRFSFDVTPVLNGNQMLDLAKHWSIPDDAVHNTLYLADLVEDNFFSDKRNRYARYEGLPEGVYAEEELARLARNGLQLRMGKNVPQNYRDRLDYELQQLKRMDFSDYLLTVNEWLEACRKEGIRTGPGRGCLEGDAQVLTKQGWKSLRDVHVGDYVVTHENRWRRVFATQNYDVKESMTRLKVNYGPRSGITMTNDHKVLVCPRTKVSEWNPKNSSYKSIRGPEVSDLTWIPAERVQPGDWMWFPTKPLRNKALSEFYTNTVQAAIGGGVPAEDLDYDEDPNWVSYHGANGAVHVMPKLLEWDEETMWWFGKWMADGWIRDNRRSVGICYNPQLEPEQGVRIRRWLAERGIDSWFERDHQPTSHNIDISNQIFFGFVKALFGNVDSRSKSWPRFFARLPDASIRALLQGYCDGDGFVRGGTALITTISHDLATSTQAMIRRLGYPAKIKVEKSYKGTAQQAYKVVFPAAALQNKETNIASGVYLTPERDGFFLKVRSTDTVPSCDKVYDISVAEDTSYLTDIGIVHNSAPGSLVVYALGISHIDPIAHDLLFERFMSMSRCGKAMHFSDTLRKRIVEYLEQ